MRTWYRQLDYPLLVIWLLLTSVGLLAIYSTTHGPAAEFLLESVQQNFQRQLFWLGVCVFGLVIALLLPVRFFQAAAYPIYGLTLLLLLATLLAGKEVNGAKAWLVIGPAQFQVSELAKVGTVLAVARLLSGKRPTSNGLRYALLAVALLVVPGGIILLQNDTGTALVFFGLVPVVLFWSGLPLPILMLMISPAVAGYFAIVYMPAAVVLAVLFTGYMFWTTREYLLSGLALLFTGGTAGVISFAIVKVLQPHQVARILSFTNPEAKEYRNEVGYHLVQSKAAIGSGGLFGKGFMKGTQTQGAYIPEQSTDFVFSVIGEEFGFIGSAVVLFLFAALLVRLIQLGTQIKHPFGVMVACGACGIYLIHVFINMGMATGLLPVIGIPLPFLSYGGSALLANSAMLSIVLTLHMRRNDFSIYGY